MTVPTPPPVAIIGAGPVGLAAAAHLLERGEEPLVFESGPRVGHAVRQWSHVRMFSPWSYDIDPAARRLLDAAGWQPPAPDEIPTGGELVARYLEPEGFARFESLAYEMGFEHAAVGAMVRSSYHADEQAHAAESGRRTALSPPA